MCMKVRMDEHTLLKIEKWNGKNLHRWIKFLDEEIQVSRGDVIGHVYG